MTPEMITKVTECALTVIVLLVSAYLIPWLKTKISEEKLEELEKFCEQAVRAAEQLYTPEEYKLKKAYVLSLINEQIEKLGLGLNEAEIDAIIEGIVNYVKHNKKYGE
ncbi:MAG: hypothetical protein IJ821_06730 [Lachnospiraceae bacterium]|nr:hypothetical protein [Lachnospiraceae bacterium]